MLDFDRQIAAIALAAALMGNGAQPGMRPGDMQLGQRKGRSPLAVSLAPHSSSFGLSAEAAARLRSTLAEMPTPQATLL